MKDTKATRRLVAWISKKDGEGSLVSKMSSVEGRTIMLGTAISIMNFGALLITEGQEMKGLMLFIAGAGVIYTRELFFDVEYNGKGNIVDAIMHNEEEDE